MSGLEGILEIILTKWLHPCSRCHGGWQSRNAKTALTDLMKKSSLQHSSNIPSAHEPWPNLCFHPKCGHLQPSLSTYIPLHIFLVWPRPLRIWQGTSFPWILRPGLHGSPDRPSTSSLGSDVAITNTAWPSQVLDFPEVYSVLSFCPEASQPLARQPLAMRCFFLAAAAAPPADFKLTPDTHARVPAAGGLYEWFPWHSIYRLAFHVVSNC